MRALLGLGGNLGEPRVAMATALVHLDRAGVRILAVSRLYRTPPWGRTDQPDFLNCCATVETQLEPKALLDLCLATEKGLHRVRDERWGPRTIDIDVIDYEGRSENDEALTLPHPHAHRRAFVLVPLLDVAPDVILQGRAAADWLGELETGDIRPETEDGDWWRASS